MGQGKTAEQGRSCELPLNRDRREPIAPDELRSSCAKAPLPVVFALSGSAARYMQPSDGNHFHKGTIPMAIPIERVENRIPRKSVERDDRPLCLNEVTSGANVTLMEPYDDGVHYGAREIDGMGQGHGG